MIEGGQGGTMTNEAMIAEHEGTVWQPDIDLSRRLVLAAILKSNPIPFAYRLNYLANFYVGPLIKNIESSFRMTRPEWIVLFCLSQLHCDLHQTPSHRRAIVG